MENEPKAASRRWFAAIAVAALLGIAGLVRVSRRVLDRTEDARAQAFATHAEQARRNAVQRPIGTPPAMGPDAAGITAPPHVVTVEAGTAPARTGPWLEAAWGAGAEQFGRSGGSESNPEAPMSVRVGAAGHAVVLDQVNRRVQFVTDGRVTGALAMPSNTVQDVATGPGGRVALLDRLGPSGLTITREDGTVLAQRPVAVGGIPEGGAATGVFGDAEGWWVENAHREVVRVAFPDGSEDPAHKTLWGRPSRDGRTLLRAAITDRAAGVVTVTAAARENGAIDWATSVRLGGMVGAIVMLDGDAHGRSYLGATRVQSARGRTVDVLFLVRLDDSGRESGRLEAAALESTDEVFRRASVDDDGTVYVLVPDAAGLHVLRYVFPD